MGCGFEDLTVWQRARDLCAAIVPVLRVAASQRDFALAHQLNGAALSVMANIAEGHLRTNRRQFVYFLRIAAGSNGETRACLYAALDRKYLTRTSCETLVEATNEIGRLLQGLIRSLRDSGGPSREGGKSAARHN
jgi:four helix bundle protein